MNRLSPFLAVLPILLQDVLVMNLQQGHISLPCEHSLFQASVSGNHSYAATGFRVLPDVSATWMWIYATCINIPVASLLSH